MKNPNTEVSTYLNGQVFFIGAGPGDPELLTLKAARLIAAADVILYAGSLVNPRVLEHARQGVEIHNTAGMKLEQQVEVMRQAVSDKKTVVRLHTGDPSIFGATAEQMHELEKSHIPCHIVPGVSSAFAAAAALGIEYTLPQKTQTVIFTRLEGSTPVPEPETLSKLASHHTSLVIFLSTGMINRVVEELTKAGYSLQTPVAVVARASWPDEKIIHGTLQDIAERLQIEEISHQALIIVSPSLEARHEQPVRSHLYGSSQESTPRKKQTAIITLTRGGFSTGLRVLEQMPGAVIYTPERFAPQDHSSDIIPFSTSIRQVIQTAFQEYSALICIMSTGIVVREIAPLLGSKQSDPAIVVLDEAGHYVVSLLSGHLGGANRLAVQIAAFLGAEAVLTTSSDVQGLPALDLLGSEWGWKIMQRQNLTTASAALVNGDVLGLFQDAGDESWMVNMPSNIHRFESLTALRSAAPSAALIITQNQISDDFLKSTPNTIVYHPPCLVIGVGCNRGTTAGEILEAIESTLNEAGLAPASIATIATIEDKSDEAGLHEVSQQRGWPIKFFSRDQINAAGTPPNPSKWAMQQFNVPGVAEPTAILASGNTTLVVEKHKYPNVTVAVALIAVPPITPTRGNSHHDR